jgi:ribosomal protein RSM22 (predicted rRNA methylase)
MGSCGSSGLPPVVVAVAPHDAICPVAVKTATSIIYIFGQHIELPRASKISRNSHINQRKKKEKLPTTVIMKKLN